MTSATHTAVPDSAPTTAAGTAGRKPRRERQGAAYVFLTPWILGVGLLTLVPMAVSLYLSFTDYDLFDAAAVDRAAQLHARCSPRTRATGARSGDAAVRRRSAVPLKLLLALGVALLLNHDGAARASTGPRSTRRRCSARACPSPSCGGRSSTTAAPSTACLPSSASTPAAGSATRTGRSTLVALLAVWQFGAPMVIFLAGLKQMPARTVRGGGGGRRGPVAAVLLRHPADALPGALLQPGPGDHPRPSRSSPPRIVISGGRAARPTRPTVYTLYLYERGFADSRWATPPPWPGCCCSPSALVTVVLFRTSRSWVFYAGEGA